MKDILERFCPVWSVVFGNHVKCFEDCAWYEMWTNLDEGGAEQDGVCLLFNLRYLNWLRGGGDEES